MLKKSGLTTRPEYVPPLENGDRLTVDEFMRRYEAMPGVKAELIRGIVYIRSASGPNTGGVTLPVNHRRHGRPHARIMTWLGNYTTDTPGVDLGDSSTIRFRNLDSTVQPDAFLLLPASAGGRLTEGDDGYLDGAPDLVAEVAAGSAALDMNEKRQTYLDAGVREYVVWRVDDDEVDWFIRHGRRFRASRPGDDGLYRSRTFPGLWLDAAALARGDMRAVEAALRRGTATPEHAAFVGRLGGG